MGKTHDAARGKWRGILLALGVDAKLLNKRNGPCPFCGGTDRFRFTDKGGDGMYFCSQCGTGNGIQFVQALKGVNFQEAASMVDKVVGIAPATVSGAGDAKNQDRMRQTWVGARKITPDDPAGRYLRRRTGLETFPKQLRFSPDEFYQDDAGKSHHPCMVARMQAPSGRGTMIHRTYLSEDGGKAAIERPKRLMPGSVEPGSAVRLVAPRDGALGIAEGIETAISAGLLFGIPCWAALAEGYLKAWIPPAGLDRVIVFGDNDHNYVGQAAAYELARKLSLVHHVPTVEVRIPTKGGDWNDIWKVALDRKF